MVTAMQLVSSHGGADTTGEIANPTVLLVVITEKLVIKLPVILRVIPKVVTGTVEIAPVDRVEEMVSSQTLT